VFALSGVEGENVKRHVRSEKELGRLELKRSRNTGLDHYIDPDSWLQNYYLYLGFYKIIA